MNESAVRMASNPSTVPAFAAAGIALALWSGTPIANKIAVGYMDASCRDLALRIAAVLRGVGQECDLALGAEKPRKFFSRADKIGASSAIYIGPREAASKSFEIKAMASGEVARATLESLGEQV